MPKFCTEHGKLTNADDPSRAIWYGQCGFWTDDWSLLSKFGPGIPCCPKCTTPGYIATASQWLGGAEEFDKKEKGYLECLKEHKEKCFRHYPAGLSTVWEITKLIKEQDATTNDSNESFNKDFQSPIQHPESDQADRDS